MSSAFMFRLTTVVITILHLCRDASSTTDFTPGAKTHVGKRSVLAFPPDSILQITMGITLSESFERNSGVIVLAFQQNAELPNDSRPLFDLPSQVVTGRQFSIYDHLKDVISRYGFDGWECLKKMICQTAETPLVGGLLEEVITFVLTPSKHRGLHKIRSDKYGKNYLDLLLESEAIGRSLGNCTSSYPQCGRTPLDIISTFIHS